MKKTNSQWQNITSFEKACERTKCDPSIVNQISINHPLQKWLRAAFRLAIVFEAVNTFDDGTVWTPDRSDRNQPKYFSWHEIEKSGGGFSHAYYDSWGSCSFVGSRLETDTYEKVMHINKYFEQDWKEFKLLLP